jgi:hypothetical protein
MVQELTRDLPQESRRADPQGDKAEDAVGEV